MGHDDRIDSEEEKEKLEQNEQQDKPRRVPRSETTEKWGHDKFMEDDQAPKSKQELVSTYGYDIRNEDNAPRARRRRRYGRGPNKYTRNWEDEEAYEGKNSTEAAVSGANPSPDKNVRNESNSYGRGRGRSGGGMLKGNAKNATTLKISDKEQFPALGGPSTKEDRVEKEPLPEKDMPKVQQDNFDNERRGGGQRGGGGVRGRRGGGPRRGGFEQQRGGDSGAGVVLDQTQKSTGKPRSANQRLQKEPRPVYTPAAHKLNNEGQGRLDTNHKSKIQDDKTKYTTDSPSSNRKSNFAESDSSSRQPKRYSNSRQGGQRNNSNNQKRSQGGGGGSTINQEYAKVNNMSAGSSGQATNFANTKFTTNSNGPPPAAPFLPTGTPTSTSSFLDPNAMVNYGPPPPVQLPRFLYPLQ